MSENSLLAFFRTDSPPFILTVIIGAAAWWITHTVDRAISQPIVEFSIRETSVDCEEYESCKSVILRIENLSDTRFSEVEFELQTRNLEGKFIGQAKVAMEPPAGKISKTKVVNDSLLISFEEFHPRFVGVFNAKYANGDQLVLLLKKSATSMKLVKPSMETFFVRHEFVLLFGALELLFVTGLAMLNKSRWIVGGTSLAGITVLLAIIYI